jgi:hypothetical protein
VSTSLYPTHRVLWMPIGLDWQPAAAKIARCCDAMRAALEFGCDQHEDPFDCPDTLMVYNEPFDEYGLPIGDGGMSYLRIESCPWCGTRLPASQRDRWFDVVEAAGLDPDDIDTLPKEFLCAGWRTGKSH